MLYPLLYPLADRFQAFNLFRYITFRSGGAVVTALLISFVFGRPIIAWLRSKQTNGQPIRLDGPAGHLTRKKGTPTMGGFLILLALTVATLLWADLTNPYVWIVLLVTVGFGLIGFFDDYKKLTSNSHRGLSGWTKIVLEIGVGAVACVVLVRVTPAPLADTLAVPFFKNVLIDLDGLFVPFGVVVIIGASNAVNLTDGLDGLAGGCTVFAGSAFVALAYLAGHRTMSEYLGIPFISGCGELSVVLGAMVGAMLGFLWFNCYPAQVFMGDTGALPVGALLALAALASRQEALLVIVGGIFVIETVSVLLQVGWYRLTGHRLIACSPLHNHFLFKGQHEIKIVVRFWIGSALLAIVGVASLKLR